MFVFISSSCKLSLLHRAPACVLTPLFNSVALSAQILDFSKCREYRKLRKHFSISSQQPAESRSIPKENFPEIKATIPGLVERDHPSIKGKKHSMETFWKIF